MQKKYIVQKGFHTSYKAVKRIGKGVTACVYCAQRFLDGKEVAIKSFKRSVYFASDHNNGKVIRLLDSDCLQKIVQNPNSARPSQRLEAGRSLRNRKLHLRDPRASFSLPLLIFATLWLSKKELGQKVDERFVRGTSLFA